MKKKEEHGSTLAEQVADGLLEHIRMKGLKTGDRLGTEMEMAEQLKVSRGTIREAIKILVSQNILEVRQGSGTFLSDGKGNVGDPLGLKRIPEQFRLTWDLHQIRMLLEPDIAYMAAMNITDEQLKELEGICEEMERLSGLKQQRLHVDVEFHIYLAKTCGNLVMPKLIPIIRQSVDLFIKYTHREAEPETEAKHRDILEALKARNPMWAKDMMLMHLTYNGQELRREALRRGETLEKLVIRKNNAAEDIIEDENRRSDHV
ncbi:MAG: FadR family transcriptional regulator [Lachnospiraceae bacterium]|jgi:GntR family transcriptional repressor for pyruvate dehydrogenase complex|nr:FadR family transcriptional regulator [Lachnospiraceae bacterium]MCI8872894.1 FadR family transcriptional regulator [Lachnospiraceae bacterium]MCI9059567.1 FadR family transcriptional regulator [Lachnospiraceae bacterium]